MTARTWCFELRLSIVIAGDFRHGILLITNLQDSTEVEERR